MKKAIINPKNTKDERCFAYSIIASIHKEGRSLKSHRISKLKPFIDNYDWTDIIFPSEKKYGISLKEIIKMCHLISLCLHMKLKRK